MALSPNVRRTALCVTFGLLVCGLIGYFIAGTEGRNMGSLVGAIAGASFAALRKQN